MNVGNKDESWDVAKATRDAIVGTAASMQALRQKTDELARMAAQEWEELNPRSQRAKGELKKRQ